MILAAVDDLMFRSRIRSAAGAADVRFAQGSDALVEQARELHPARILLDLNARGFDPLALVARLKADPDLRGIPVVGFVSHVQSEVIAAARRAGIDQVLARSAFVARLPELIAE